MQEELCAQMLNEDQDCGLSGGLNFCWFGFLPRIYRVSDEPLPLDAARSQRDVTLGKLKGRSLAPYLTKRLGSDSAFVKLSAPLFK